MPRSPRPAACMTNIAPNMGAWATRSGPLSLMKPDWLHVFRHRVRGFRVPYLLVVQHHAIPSATRLAAPVSPPLPGDVDVLAPRLMIDGTEYRARVLDMRAISVALLGGVV